MVGDVSRPERITHAAYVQTFTHPRHEQGVSARMTGAVGAVLIASASSVTKVFLISAVGYFAVKYPKGNPLLPPGSIGILSRFAFTILNLPLIYSAIGSTLSIDVLGTLWFVPIAGVAVISLSFLVATATERLPFLRVGNRVDFEALRIASSFPNVVAIPVLVFPSLCEYEVVYSGFIDEARVAGRGPIEQCSNSLNAMTFSYFFAWIFMFFLMGNRVLVSAGARKKRQSVAASLAAGLEAGGGDSPADLGGEDDGDSISISTSTSPGPGPGPSPSDRPAFAAETAAEIIGGGVGGVAGEGPALGILAAIRGSVLNPGAIALWCGLATALIGPLQAALFGPGGTLRFAGSAVESLAQALPSVATMITAATLAHPGDGDGDGGAADDGRGRWWSAPVPPPLPPPGGGGGGGGGPTPAERPGTSGLRRSLRRASSRAGSTVLRGSRLLGPALRGPTFRMHLWFNLTRLVATPALVCGCLIGLDCRLPGLFGGSGSGGGGGGGGGGAGVPHMAKLVVLLNSAVPSALLVILSLRSEGLPESAHVVARCYLPSYLLSVLTVAGWSAVGLMLSIPGEDGAYFCPR